MSYNIDPKFIMPSFSRSKLPFYVDIFDCIIGDMWVSFSETIPNRTINKLFQRYCFKLHAEEILKGVMKSIIVGPVGVGKSMFLVYLLARLVKANKRVLFFFHPNLIYYDGERNIYELDKAPPPWHHDFWNEDLWCLYDAGSSHDFNLLPYNRCRFVITSVPDSSNLYHYMKPPVPKIFSTEPWNGTELRAISVLFPPPAFHRQNWLHRAQILGGLPRYIFEDNEEDARKVRRRLM